MEDIRSASEITRAWEKKEPGGKERWRKKGAGEMARGIKE